MGLRKAASYSKKIVVPYTRKSKVKSKAYIKAVPNADIAKYSMGNEVWLNIGKLPCQLTLITTENVQIRDNALEACRQFLNKKIETAYPGQFYIRVLVHPHHIQRENKMLTGAGADRMQTGMALSFGKAVDRAAILKKGKGIFYIAVVDKKAEQFVRKMLGTIRAKLPCKTQIVSGKVI
jgi:large subunit ribosomal protein L10e